MRAWKTAAKRFRSSRLRTALLIVALLPVAQAPAADKHHFSPPPPSGSLRELESDERAIVRAFQRVSPSVVVLFTEEMEVTQEDEELHLTPGKGIGSGVVISEEGDILTAAHVVRGARNIKARLHDGSEWDASLLFSDPAADIAVVRLSGDHPGVPPALLGDSDRVLVGQTTLVMGAPLGVERSLSVGHISARRRGDEILGGGVAAELLQTDAAVNKGNSGGPLVNLKGEVIGIVSRILTTTGGSQGLGFAIASNTVKGLLGEDPVPWIGVNALFIGSRMTAALHIPADGALLVQSVVEGSPAEQAGIHGGDLPALLGSAHLILGGDVILAIDEQETCHRECVAHELQRRSLATVLEVTVWRDGTRIRMEIPVEHRRVLRQHGPAVEEKKER